MKLFFRCFLLLFFLLRSAFIYAQLLDSVSLASAKEYKSLKAALEKPEDVYRLTLKRKKLSAIPPEIFSLKNLNELNLSHNKINFIPPEISYLQNLQNLNLAKNELRHLSPEIAKLKNLQVLNLNRNKLQTLPPEMGRMYSLKELDIWGTEIDELPYELSSLKHTLLKLDMRVIYMNRYQQAEILKWFPLTEVLFSKPCNCQ